MTSRAGISEMRGDSRAEGKIAGRAPIGGIISHEKSHKVVKWAVLCCVARLHSLITCNIFHAVFLRWFVRKAKK